MGQTTNDGETVKKYPLFHAFSRRMHLIFLLMTGFCCTTFMRTHLAITMNCMVNSTAISAIEDDVFHIDHNETFVALDSDIFLSANEGQCQAAELGKHVVIDYGGSLIWSHSEQNIVFSGTFWGSLITVLPSMFVIQRSSPRVILLIAVLVYAFSSATTPFLATRMGYITVFLDRSIMGFGEGLVLPSINWIVTNWFPTEERSTAVALFTTGNQIAGAGGNALAASLCASSVGWPSIFYLCGIVSTIWCIVWFMTSSNRPSQCKLMTNGERAYLNSKLFHGPKREKKLKVPYLKIMTSPAFLAQLQCNFFTNLAMTFLQIYLPTYLKDVLLLGVIANGSFIAIPNISNVTFKIFWSISMDKLKERKIISTTTACKISQLIANFGIAISMTCVALFVDCSTPGLALVLFTFMFCTMGAFTSGFYTSLLCLAPRHTSTLSSISQFAGMIGRLCSPFIVGLIKTTGTVDEWNKLFFITAFLSVISGMIFIKYGSGEMQEWGAADAERKLVERVVDQEEDKVLLKTI